MKGTLHKGILHGIADGPVLVVEVRGEEMTYPLDCDLTLEWIQTHMGKQVTFLLDEGRAKQVV